MCGREERTEMLYEEGVTPVWRMTMADLLIAATLALLAACLCWGLVVDDEQDRGDEIKVERLLRSGSR